MTEKENPYLKMDDATFTKHVDQIKEYVDKKKLSTIQFFGESLSEDTQTKLDEHASLTTDKASLTTQVKTLEDAATAGEMSEDVKKLAKLSIDSAVSEIKGIDENFPIQGVVDSISDPFQKVDALKHLKVAADYSKKAVDALKSQIPVKTGTQGFGEAPKTDSDEAERIFNEVVAKSGVKIENVS